MSAQRLPGFRADSGRQRCPVCCSDAALRVRTGAGGLFILCANGCDRDAILAALDRREGTR